MNEMMKEILVDFDDIHILKEHKWYISSLGYVTAHETGKSHKTRRRLWLHRLIMNAPDNRQVDHINLNKLDNRKCNLRLATDSQNKANRLMQKNNTHSMIKGVYPSGKKFRVRIQKDKKKINLGTYNTLEEAHSVYLIKAKEIWGEFAR